MKIALSMFFFATVARADYVATGPFLGQECHFLGTICSMKSIDAVSGEDGKLYSMATVYKDVTEFSSNGRCHITPGLARGDTSTYRPAFFHKKEDGSFDKVDIEDLSFPCAKK